MWLVLNENFCVPLQNKYAVQIEEANVCDLIRHEQMVLLLVNLQIILSRKLNYLSRHVNLSRGL